MEHHAGLSTDRCELVRITHREPVDDYVAGIVLLQPVGRIGSGWIYPNQKGRSLRAIFAGRDVDGHVVERARNLPKCFAHATQTDNLTTPFNAPVRL